MWRALRQAWQARREMRLLRRRAIPDALWRLTLARHPFLQWLPSEDQNTLRRLATLFLAEKEFHGIQGFEVSDEVAVAVAAQACLLILHQGLFAYSGFVGIVMHADAVLARREVMDDDGLVHEYEEVLSGEAMEGGPLMLCWSDVEGAGLWNEGPAYNVVIHEFAHVLDMADGQADGIPPQVSGASRVHWQQVLQSEWQQFFERVDAAEQSGSLDSIELAIDPYGAEGPEEFFAVAVEAFFVTPLNLRAQHKALYDLLQSFFQQDPAQHQASQQARKVRD